MALRDWTERAIAVRGTPAYNRVSAGTKGASERGARMRLFGSAMVALLVAFSGAASAESGVTERASPSVSASLDFRIVVTSTLALDEAARGCGTSPAQATCRGIALPVPGRRGEHRATECVRRGEGPALTCTTSSP